MYEAVSKIVTFLKAHHWGVGGLLKNGYTQVPEGTMGILIILC